MNYILIDATRITTIQNCPQKFQYLFEYNKRRITEKSYFEKGTILHKMLRVYYASLKYRQRWYLTEFNYDKLVQLCVRVGEYFGIRGNIEISDLEIITNAFNQYCEYYRHDSSFTKNRILYLEQYFARPLLEPFTFEGQEYQVVVEGRIDLNYLDENNNQVVVDYKSESRTGSFSLLRNQFQTYPWATGARILTVNVIGLQKTVAPEKKFYRKTFNYSDALIHEFELNTLHHCKQYLIYKANNYFPKNYSACDTYGICEFEGICSAPDEDLKQIRWERDFKESKWDVFQSH